jgi:ribulose-5-phosphate 4-epimerase/fuculose-1-phosphate aldolase
LGDAVEWLDTPLHVCERRGFEMLTQEILQKKISEVERQARIDLAAAHRFAGAMGWTNLIYNHFTLRLQDDPQYFLVKPHELMFEEVTASSLIKVDLDGKPVDERINLNAAGFTIHTAVLRAMPEINAVAHVHTEAGMAMAAHGGGLKFMTQASMRFYDRISYHNYEGISSNVSEREQIASDLGGNKAMILKNHGLLTCGTSIREAVVLMKHLIQCCSSQLMLEATGAEILIPSPQVCKHAASQWDKYDSGGASAEWPAILRMMDRADPSYRD